MEDDHNELNQALTGELLSSSKTGCRLDDYMGYGGFRKEAGQVTQYTVDGRLYQRGPIGLDMIYLRAKR